MRQAIRRTLAAGLFALALGLWVGPDVALAQPGQVNLTFTPRDTIVSPGADFWVSMDVTSATTVFNGWEGVLSYDPARLTYLPTVPRSAQQGCLMVGACSDGSGNSACGSAYIEISNAADSISTLDILLCSQIYLTAPGRIIRYHFRASSTAGPTSLQVRWLAFYNSTWGNPGTLSGPATIQIGQGSTAVDPPTSARGLRVSATPNPSRGVVTLALETEGSGEQEVTVHDVSGRLVRVLSRGWQAAGARQLVWDGLDGTGSHAAPGVYLVMLRAGNRRTQSRVTLLD